MSWNEPDNKDKKDSKDPWGSRPNEQGPPDLQDVVKDLQDKFGKLFGASGGPSGDSNGGGTTANNGPSPKGLIAIAVIALIVWSLSGFYIVDEGNRGVEMRFGAYSETTQPGPHFHLPYPIENVQQVDVQQLRAAEIGYRSGSQRQSSGSVPREALMLTEDENIVDIRIAVQYEVKDAPNFLFNVADPEGTLKQATESSIREIIGKRKMDFVLTEGRAEVTSNIRSLLQATLDKYQSGINITSVNMQDAQPPEEVQGAFADAIKAREDLERFKNEAEAYASEVVPIARGLASRLIKQAEGYKDQVIAKAEGEASRFEQVYAEYKKAPEVTRERLYIDTMESALSNSGKVLVDVEGGNNLLYLPLDKIIPRGTSNNALPETLNSMTTSSSPSSSSELPDLRNRDLIRRRIR